MAIFRRIALVISLVALVTCSWLAPLDAPAMKQVDAGLKRALVSFATARTFNGVISVLQGTQIDIQPGGLGATLAPGQIVAPINELVKQFADLMVLASVAFGIQKVLISISAYWAISLLLTLVAVGWASFSVRQRQPPRWLSKTLVVLLMLRFAVPVVTIGTDWISTQFMAADYETSQAAIDLASGQVEKANPGSTAPAASSGWWGKITGALPSMPAIPDFSAMKLAAEQATEHMIRLMAIFLLQTLVVPLLLLWGLYGAARSVFEGSPRSQELSSLS
jgi:hypothetical protein